MAGQEAWHQQAGSTPFSVMLSRSPQASATSHAGCSDSSALTAAAAAKRAWVADTAASPPPPLMRARMYLRAMRSALCNPAASAAVPRVLSGFQAAHRIDQHAASRTWFGLKQKRHLI